MLIENEEVIRKRYTKECVSVTIKRGEKYTFTKSYSVFVRLFYDNNLLLHVRNQYIF